jgi:hypothetical protein
MAGQIFGNQIFGKDSQILVGISQKSFIQVVFGLYKQLLYDFLLYKSKNGSKGIILLKLYLFQDKIVPLTKSFLKFCFSPLLHFRLSKSIQLLANNPLFGKKIRRIFGKDQLFG